MKEEPQITRPLPNSGSGTAPGRRLGRATLRQQLLRPGALQLEPTATEPWSVTKAVSVVREGASAEGTGRKRREGGSEPLPWDNRY